MCDPWPKWIVPLSARTKPRRLGIAAPPPRAGRCVAAQPGRGGARPGTPGPFPRTPPVAVAACAPIGPRGVGATRSPGAMARTHRLPAPGGCWAGGGCPGGKNGFCEVSAPGPGHNAALPLDARVRTRRRHLPGVAWTGASFRGQGSGSCVQPGTGPGLQQVSSGPGARARARGGAARRPRGVLTGPSPPCRATRGLDMSAQEPPQGRRFPIEAGDSPGLAATPESQDNPEPVATEHNRVR